MPYDGYEDGRGCLLYVVFANEGGMYERRD